MASNIEIIYKNVQETNPKLIGDHPEIGDLTEQLAAAYRRANVEFVDTERRTGPGEVMSPEGIARVRQKVIKFWKSKLTPTQRFDPDKFREFLPAFYQDVGSTLPDNTPLTALMIPTVKHITSLSVEERELITPEDIEFIPPRWKGEFNRMVNGISIGINELGFSNTIGSCRNRTIGQLSGFSNIGEKTVENFQTAFFGGNQN